MAVYMENLYDCLPTPFALGMFIFYWNALKMRSFHAMHLENNFHQFLKVTHDADGLQKIAHTQEGFVLLPPPSLECSVASYGFFTKL